MAFIVLWNTSEAYSYNYISAGSMNYLLKHFTDTCSVYKPYVVKYQVEVKAQKTCKRSRTPYPENVYLSGV